jgi:non-homologous end joining protein Ku
MEVIDVMFVVVCVCGFGIALYQFLILSELRANVEDILKKEKSISTDIAHISLAILNIDRKTNSWNADLSEVMLKLNQNQIVDKKKAPQSRGARPER